MDPFNSGYQIRVVWSNWKVGICAAKAFYSCPAIISRRPRSQNTSKEPQLNSEEDSRIKHARSHVTLEKSSKNLISVFGERPARWLPKPPPTPPHRESAEFTRGKNTISGSGRGFGTRRKGEGGGITQNLITHQWNNISTPYFKRR